LPRRTTRRLILQKAHGQALKRALPYLVSIRFQVLFHSPPGVLFTFPSRYSCTIGYQVVFSLTGWSPQIPTEFLVFRGTQVPVGSPPIFRVRGSHPLWLAFPNSIPLDRGLVTSSLPVVWETGPITPLLQRLPPWHRQRFGLFRVRSPLLTESLFCFLFLRVLRCFSSPGVALLAEFASYRSEGFPIRKSPGHRMLTPHRGLSQQATSFIASWPIGIRRMPLFA